MKPHARDADGMSGALSLPMRGYEHWLIRARDMPSLVISPHEGL